MPNSYPVIPPVVNTDSKNLNSNENDPLKASLQGFDKALGVVASEGEALYIDDDIPACFKEGA